MVGDPVRDSKNYSMKGVGKMKDMNDIHAVIKAIIKKFKKRSILDVTPLQRVMALSIQRANNKEKRSPKCQLSTKNLSRM